MITIMCCKWEGYKFVCIVFLSNLFPLKSFGQDRNMCTVHVTFFYFSGYKCSSLSTHVELPQEKPHYRCHPLLILSPLVVPFTSPFIRPFFYTPKYFSLEETLFELGRITIRTKFFLRIFEVTTYYGF